MKNKIVQKIREMYREEWNNWKLYYRRLFYIALLVLVLSIIAGFIYYQHEPEKTRIAIGELKHDFEGFLATDSRFVDFAYFFGHNLKISFLTFILGFIPFLSFLNVWFLGKGLGLICFSLYLKSNKLLMIASITGLLPHGIFEIPAYLHSVSLGMILFLQSCKILRRIFWYSEQKDYSKEKYIPILVLLKSFVRITVPLLLIAAFIEAFISPWLVKVFVLSNIKVFLP